MQHNCTQSFKAFPGEASLYILTDESLAFGGWDGSFCGKCGDTHLGKCTIEEWLEEEKKRADKRREIEWSK